jgi:hypothetical protein
MAEDKKGIFISYRRGDTTAYAMLLEDALGNHFGKQNVFRDIGSIEPGVDFVTAIERALETCAVMLVVIGRDWETKLMEHEQPGHEDYMRRLEVATALKRNVRVIPLLVEEASMPSADKLPDDLVALARRTAVQLHDPNWQSDVQHLITFLETVTGRRQPTAGSTTAIGVRPHSRSANEDVFRMELDEFYDHPGVQGFLVNCALYETTLRMQVRPHYGSQPLLFAFDDFPKNTWVPVQDNQGNTLPLAVYVDGAMGVYGKWLYPQLPPA